MFETAEVGNRVSKKEFESAAAKLRADLLSAQRELAGSRHAAVVLVGGVEAAGKATTVNLLLEWMDSRGIETHALSEPSDEERERPPMWRFWRLLPPRGRMGIFLGSWYTQPIVDRVFHRLKDAEFERRLDRIAAFEEMLAHDGTMVIKLWLHLSKKAQRERLESLEKSRLTRWRVTKQDWKFHRKYDDFREVCERALRKTSTGFAPWEIIEATDGRYRNLAVGRHLVAALKAGPRGARPEGAPSIEASPKGRGASKLPVTVPESHVTLLSRLDLTRKLPKPRYEKDLATLQGRLNRLSRRLHDEKRSLILVVEGPDAGGKGGTIRRLTGAMDARQYRVTSIAAPTEEERAHPWLWRFWRDLPRRGRVTIYDRSWYGRVLVERVEGFAATHEWQRAYSEINSFEEQLAESGTILLKIWIAISREEQLRRFRDREKTPYKQYKITEEDWRNRAKWEAYDLAAEEMIEKTSTTSAPWILVEGEDKRWARVRALREVCRAVKAAL